MVRTYLLKLYIPNEGKKQELLALMHKQYDCVNWWIDRIRQVENTNVRTLHQEFYRKAREEFGLSADITQVAMFRAIRMARVAKKRRAESPHLTKMSLCFRKGYVDGSNLGVNTGTGKKLWLPFKGRDIPTGAIRESLITVRGNEWFCNLYVGVDEMPSVETKGILGIDLGIARVAVVSDEHGHNNVFFDGEAYRSKRSHYYSLRKRLQPKVKQGNVYKLIKRVSSKEHNWIENENHKISRAIVNKAIKEKKSIAMENLTGIRKRVKMNKKTRRMIHSWAFRELAVFIDYKARLAGIPYVTVDPRETSKTCPKCKNVSRRNRKSQSRFVCTKCHYESNADRIGAMNIAKRATELGASL